MSQFEDEEDFELEFSDLPPDEAVQRSVSGQLVASGSRLLSTVQQLTERLSIQSSRVSAIVRAWLLEDVTSKQVVHSPVAKEQMDEDFELEFSDLPPVKEHTFSQKLFILGTRLTPRVRLWRLGLTACTVCMILFLVFASFPSPRNWLYTLVVPPTPTQVALSSVLIARDISQPPPPGPAPITPGPMPNTMACPSPPVQYVSSLIGSDPVWISGFSGPTARVYLASSVPVPSYPSVYGFPVPLLVEVPVNYQGNIILEGKEMSNGMDVLFGYSPFNDQVPALTLNPQGQDSNHFILMSDGGTRRTAWNIVMFLPAASCYTLKATWFDGHSDINFLAGK